MTRKVKRAISAIVSFALMLTVLATPLGDILPEIKNGLISAAATEEDSIPEFIAESRSQDEVYNSDLFYGYSFYLSKSPYLLGYNSDTYNLFNNVCQDYIDSPNYFWTNFRYSIPLVFDLKSYIKNLTDAVGLTTFTYENALDAANQAFANKLLGDKTDLASQFGKSKKWVKAINNVAKIYDTFQKNYSVVGSTDEEIIEYMFVTINDTKVFEYISETQLTSIKEYVLPKISDIVKCMSYGADALTAAKCIVMGLAMEDMRFGIIQEILNSQQKNTMLYDGMNRLNNQLRNNFASYFFDNYLKGKILDYIADKIISEIEDYFVDGEYQALYKLIGACVNVANWVVFDVIFDVPSVDEVTTALVLREYANDFYDLTQEKINKFQTQFSIKDIEKFQEMLDACICATNAAFDACEKLVLPSNEELFNTVKEKYKDADIYTNVIDWAKALVKAIPIEERTVYVYDSWTTPENVDFTICKGSDIIEENKFYYITNNQLPNNFTVNKKSTLHLDSDIKMDKLTFCVYSDIEAAPIKRKIELGKLDLNISGSWDDTVDVTFSNYDIYLNSDLNIIGDYYISHWSKIRLKSSKLYVKGKIYLGYQSYLNINDSSEVSADSLYMTCSANAVTALNIDNSKMNIYGDTVLQGRNAFYGGGNEPRFNISGENTYVEIFGDLKISYCSRIDKLTMAGGDLFIHGDFINYGPPYDSLDISGNGMIHLCGDKVQQVKNIIFGSHLKVTNKVGLSILSDTYVYGYTEMDIDKIYLNGYKFFFSWGALFNTTTEYGDLKIYDLEYNTKYVYVDGNPVEKVSNVYTIPADNKTHNIVIEKKNGTISTNTITLKSHECEYGDWTVKNEPTCDLTGKKVRTCSLCQKTDTETTPATGHSYGEWTTTKNATCTEDGKKERTCSSCKAVDTETIDALGHSYRTEVVAPTYFEQGYTLHKCSVCGDSYKDNYTDKLVLSAVSGLKTTPASSSSLTLNWDKNDNATGYFIQQYKDGEWTHIRQLARNTATTYTATGLTPSTTYQYRVRAYYTDGSTTTYSDYTTISGTTNPANITGVKVSSTANSVTISWDKNNSATGYFVQQYKNGAWTHVRQLARNTATTFTASGLTTSTTYQYRVRAYYTDGSTTTYSDYTTISGTTNPTNISGVKAASTANSVTISWDKNDSATGYFVQQYKNGAWTHVRQLARNTATTFTASGLTPSAKYQYRIRAYYTDGTSTTYSDYKYVSPTTRPSNITGVKVTSTANTVTLSWDKNNSATGYFVQQYKNGAWTHVRQLARNTATTYTATGLTPSTTYQFRIRAYYTDGTTTTYSDYTQTLTAKTKA